MNKDFSKHAKLIGEFRGKVNKADFEAKFTAATTKIIKTERFLLKMELKRLASPCTRLIDLRGLVDGECKAYEHENRVHFLDEIAIKVFEENYQAYGGYTFGVYESVKNTKNNFRVIYEREKQSIKDPNYSPEEITTAVLEKSQYPAKYHQFGSSPNRIEERMNFAIPVLITIGENKAIQATTSDLSVRGCKIRASLIDEIFVGIEVKVRFTGLEDEFSFGRNNTFTYEVRNIQTIEGVQLIGMQRVYEKVDVKDSFTEFLKGFIQGNKRRYKINLDNTINALKIRSIEHFTLPKINELPVYIEDNAGKMSPRYALTCPNNRKVYTYWQDELNKSTLNFLITRERLKRLIKAHDEGNSLLVYSFIHTSQGKQFFYTADNVQLSNEPESISLLLGFMASKPTFKVTELSFIPANDALSDFPFTVANNLQVKDQYLNMPPSDDVKDVLANLPYIVVANDITDTRMVKNYQLFDYEKIEISKLKNFGHKRNVEPLLIDEVGIHYKNQRQEMRFKYKTPAIVELPRETLKGFSHDFSMSGLKIELENPGMLSKGDVINLAFPSLQKITSEFNLKNLPYEIIHINDKKTIINCRIYVEKHQHIGRNFFKLLIEKNRDKLEPDVHTLLTPGLGKALRNIYTASLSIPALMIQTSGSRYKIESIVGSTPDLDFLSQMKQLSDREGFYNLYPILGNSKVMDLLNYTMRNIQAKDAPAKAILYISINPKIESIIKAVNVRLESELSNDKQKEFFINNALKKGKFFCLQISISRTLEPDMEYLNPELSYIGSYAIHRGKQLEQEIWSIVGMMQLCDVTQETLFRHNLLAKTQVL